MILYKKLLLFGLLGILLPFSKGYAEKQSSIGLEILGKPTSVVKNNYSCAPTIISGPSKSKIICATSSKKLIVAAVKSRVVSVAVIQFTKESSINNVLNGFSESCQKSMKSKFKFKLNCGEQKIIILELDIVNSELRTEFCLFQYCRSRGNQ